MFSRLSFALLALVLFVLPAAAQDRWNQDYRPVLPPGTWAESCANPDLVDGGRLLRADCRDRRGGMRPAEIDLRECRGPVANDDGHLVCMVAHEEYEHRSFPGSWVETCRNPRFDEGYLSAECRARHDEWRDSQLDIRRCAAAGNRDGFLFCEQPR